MSVPAATAAGPEEPLADLDVYEVGGAVRDELLGLAVRERDYVIVGATPASLRARGFKQVGREFPVFLHPRTGAEYALARTERKTAPGYRGFAVHAAPEVTLEQDLARRDLTVNALARGADGRIVDPYGGLADLERRVLRHVSPAFVEDPVRVLRVARFAARFAALGFAIAPETMTLMRSMVAAGEVDALTPERVWRELERALATDQPERFFLVLRECGALARLLPELDRLWGVPQPAHWHPEIDTGVHVMLVLAMAAQLTPDPAVRFAALCHDLGKGTTPPEAWPSHRGHEERGIVLLAALRRRLPIPNDWYALATLVARYHGLAHKVGTARGEELLDVLLGVDALRRPSRFEQFLCACEADYRGRQGYESRSYTQGALWRQLAAACRAVDAAALARDTAASPLSETIAARVRAARLAALADVRATFAEPLS